MSGAERCPRCGAPLPPDLVQLGPLTLRATILAAEDGWSARLTWAEAEVLAALLRRAGMVMTHGQLAAVMPGPVRSVGSLRHMVCRLRQLLRGRLDLINHRGVGYEARLVQR